MKIQIKYNPEENHMQIDHIGIFVNVYIFVWKFSSQQIIIAGILMKKHIWIMNDVANFDRKMHTLF